MGRHEGASGVLAMLHLLTCGTCQGYPCVFALW